MNRLSDIYYTIENYLFPMLEEEFCEISSKMKNFFAPFEDKLSARGGGEYFKKLLNNSPKDAAIWFLVESQFRWAGVWGRYGIATAAEKFNKLYDDWKTGNNDVRKMD